jgi:hypothetical protein
MTAISGPDRSGNLQNDLSKVRDSPVVLVGHARTLREAKD